MWPVLSLKVHVTEYDKIKHFGQPLELTFDVCKSDIFIAEIIYFGQHLCLFAK